MHCLVVLVSTRIDSGLLRRTSTKESASSHLFSSRVPPAPYTFGKNSSRSH
jgi:hypothetical protein